MSWPHEGSQVLKRYRHLSPPAMQGRTLLRRLSFGPSFEPSRTLPRKVSFAVGQRAHIDEIVGMFLCIWETVIQDLDEFHKFTSTLKATVHFSVFENSANFIDEFRALLWRVNFTNCSMYCLLRHKSMCKVVDD